MEKRRKLIRGQDFATNCEACGGEHMNAELSDVILRGIDRSLRLCKTCTAKDSLSDFNDVINIVVDVVKG